MNLPMSPHRPPFFTSAKHPASRTYGVDRRKFLRYLSAVSSIPFLPVIASGQVETRPRFAGN